MTYVHFYKGHHTGKLPNVFTRNGTFINTTYGLPLEHLIPKNNNECWFCIKGYNTNKPPNYQINKYPFLKHKCSALGCNAITHYMPIRATPMLLGTMSSQKYQKRPICDLLYSSFKCIFSNPTLCFAKKITSSTNIKLYYISYKYSQSTFRDHMTTNFPKSMSQFCYSNNFFCYFPMRLSHSLVNVHN